MQHIDALIFQLMALTPDKLMYFENDAVSRELYFSYDKWGNLEKITRFKV